MSEIIRKLASIRRITKIEPINGADFLECATVDGWKVVVKKGEYMAGDLCVYFEIDSFLPVHPEYEFLRKSSFRSVEGLGDGFRIKTIKLKGQISQGLIMPLSLLDSFPVKKSFFQIIKNFFVKSVEIIGEGDDLTERFGVIKYDTSHKISLGADQAGLFPSFIPKTDQERIQNVFGKYIDKYGDHTFEATMKMDGSSMTVFYKDGYFGVCSRNFELKEGDNVYWNVVNKLNLREKLTSYGKNIAIQGELVGPGIQKNRENLPEHHFLVFDIFDIDVQDYYYPHQRDLAVINLQLEHVPIIAEKVSFKTTKFGDTVVLSTLDEFLAFADIPSVKHPIAEGVVFKSLNDPSVSFKVINNKFLLKETD